MKKVFLGLLCVAAAVSCKKTVESGDTPTAEEFSSEVISLSVGSPRISRAGNEGVRSTLFETGDQIGVTAVYQDVATDVDWSKDTCFDNRPALFALNTTDASPVSQFHWGIDGSGGTANNRYYPGAKKKIYIFAYYPFSKSTANYVAPDKTAATGPQLKVTLTEGAIAGETTDVNLKQADVLYYTSGDPTASPVAKADPFSSDSKMGTMLFRHGLAQLQFLLKRPTGSTACKFVKLVFKTAKSGTMDIATGVFTYDAAATYKDATYTITPKTGDNVVIPDITGGGTALDVLKGKPLMIFPLSLVDAKKGSLVLTVDFAKDGETADTKDITVDLTTLTDPLEAGKLNTYTLSVNFHLIELQATIKPWDTAGTNNNLDAE